MQVLKALSLSLLLLSFLAAGSACSQFNNTDQTTYNGPVHEVRQNLNPSTQPNSSQEVARHLVALSKQNNDVRDATAIVIGNQALVGLDLDKDIDPDRVGTIKHTVSRSLQKDPHGANAVVTADPDIVQRIKNLGSSIQKGKPISGIRDELTSLIERIVPDTSHSAINPNPPASRNSRQ